MPPHTKKLQRLEPMEIRHRRQRRHLKKPMLARIPRQSTSAKCRNARAKRATGGCSGGPLQHCRTGQPPLGCVRHATHPTRISGGMRRAFRRAYQDRPAFVWRDADRFIFAALHKQTLAKAARMRADRASRLHGHPSCIRGQTVQVLHQIADFHGQEIVPAAKLACRVDGRAPPFSGLRFYLCQPIPVRTL